MQFIVVTATHPQDMAAAMSCQVALVTDQRGPDGQRKLRYVEGVAAMLGVRVQNFTLGEVLICGEDGRELVGSGRKPSKWYCTTEEFDDLDAAIRRAAEVLGTTSDGGGEP